MAYRKRSTSYAKKRPTSRRRRTAKPAARRRSTPRQQTVKIVVEHVPANPLVPGMDASGQPVMAARQTEPKKARF